MAHNTQDISPHERSPSFAQRLGLPPSRVAGTPRYRVEASESQEGGELCLSSLMTVFFFPTESLTYQAIKAAKSFIVPIIFFLHDDKKVDKGSL